MNFYTFWPNTKACFDQIWPSIATGISFSMISVVVTRHISSRTSNKQKKLKEPGNHFRRGEGTGVRYQK